MINSNLEILGAEHIQQLIDNGVRENRSIEYKRSLPGTSDREKKEFLYDICAMANASGGDIVYGVDANDGIPSSIVGIKSTDIDTDILRVEGMIRDCLQPRITGVHSKSIEVNSGQNVLVIRVPKSWSSPHMVSFRGGSRFFMRNSAGKHQMDITEIRHAFEMSGQIIDRIQTWRQDRIKKFYDCDDDGPINSFECPKAILHLIPLDVFEHPYRIASQQFETISRNGELLPLGSGGYDWRYNLDGLLHFGHDRRKNKTDCTEYCQLFRSGAIESVNANLVAEYPDKMDIAPAWLERVILENTAAYLRTYAMLDIHPPLLIMTTFVGVQGLKLMSDSRAGRTNRHNISTQNTLILPDLLVESIPENLPALFRPVFDAFWNAFGFLESTHYNSNGQYTMKNLKCVPQSE